MNGDSPCCRCCEPVTKAVTSIPTDTDLFTQLLIWRAKGYCPELHPALNDQWVLLLSTDHWSMRGDINEQNRSMGLKFVTDPCPTPQDAIRAAMEIIR